jgi:hypothetical protein
MFKISIKNETVNMSPTKEFFIDTITRDINLEKAILDLIDNSIQGAKRNVKNNNYKGYYINIKLGEEFIIEDNCGGISKKDASSYVFRFGYEKNSNKKEYSSGGFGIGMKRALFKIGNNILFESNCSESYFQIQLDVQKWKNKKPWDIKFNNVSDALASEFGTRIIIRELYKNIYKEINSSNFRKSLINKVEETNRMYLKSGLRIQINSMDIPYKIRKGRNIIEKEFGLENDIKLKICIDRSEESNEKSGWYIYLNNRLVIEAEKSKLTGWGVSDSEIGISMPEFNVDFNSFRGYVYLKSKDTYKLPFNTTKDGVDENSTIYKKIRKYMMKTLNENLGEIVEKDLRFVSYQKPIKDIDLLKSELKVSSAKQVGIKTFDSYIDGLSK